MNTFYYSFNRLICDYKSKYKVSIRRIGGAKQDRTADLLRARQALSQLSYSPIFRWLVSKSIRWYLERFHENFTNQGKWLRRIACYSSHHLTPSSIILVGLGGLEPPTSPLSGVRSNHLSYRPNLACLYIAMLRCNFLSISYVVNYTPSFVQITPCLPI